MINHFTADTVTLQSDNPTFGAKFETNGSINNQSTPVRQRNFRSTNNNFAVRERLLENPKETIPRWA